MNNGGEVYTVAQLTGSIRRLIEDGLPNLWVEGEISNFKLYPSGHRYFTLKDQDAQIPCVMWRTRRQPDHKMQDGLKVRIFGKVTVYEKGGRYQFDVISVLRSGIGDLQTAFEQLKRKLDDEGLFDLSRKKTLPLFPNSIGIATSPAGAALHDLVWGFTSRFPAAALYHIPVAVQGDGAAEQIAQAIQVFNQLKITDVIVIGRGGGSLEDLWAFNEEVVVRAVAGSGIPVVSAVGHEVDVTLSDLAADLRAPTPTAAASLVVPDREELRVNLSERSKGLAKSLAKSISVWRERITRFTTGYGFRRTETRISEERLKLEDVFRKITLGLENNHSLKRVALNAVTMRIAALSPESVLKRGFCVAQRPDGKVIRSTSETKVSEEIQMRFLDGKIITLVKEILQV